MPLTAYMPLTQVPSGALVYRLGSGFVPLLEVDDKRCGYYLEWEDGRGAWRVGSVHSDKVTVAVHGPVPATWCEECGHDTAPDQYGRTFPYAVFGSANGRSMPASRNHSHASAHEYARRLVEEFGYERATVGIDSCG